MQYAGRSPYGDIYSVPTTAVDNISKRLIAQQQLKEQQERADNKALDDEFSRNMSGMRDADIGDLTKAYGNFKAAHIALQKKGAKATTEDQLNALRAKAAVSEVIQKSKQRKEQEKFYGSDIMKNPNKYVRGAHGQLVEIMRRPVSQDGDADLFEPLNYKGNMTNLQKIFANAAGKEIKMDDEIVDNEKELRKDVTHVSRMANAVEYYRSILGQVVDEQTEDDLIRSVATNISPELYNATKLQYEQMMADPVMRKRLGMTGIDLPPDEGLTEPERAAKYLAMTHQLAAKPVLKVGTPIYSKDAVMDRQEGFRKAQQARSFRQQELMEGLRQGNREKMLGVRKRYEDLSEEEKMKDVDAFIKGEEDEAKASAPKKEEGTLGMPIKASPVVLEAFTLKDPVNGKTITPSGVTLLYNGNFKLAYPSENLEDKEITRDEYKAGLVNHVFNTKVKIGQIKTNELDPNGFKKEGKYWKYKDGRLFDDKGNVIKQ